MVDHPASGVTAIMDTPGRSGNLLSATSTRPAIRGASARVGSRVMQLALRRRRSEEARHRLQVRGVHLPPPAADGSILPGAPLRTLFREFRILARHFFEDHRMPIRPPRLVSNVVQPGP